MKKILAWIICITLLFACAPVALAADQPTPTLTSSALSSRSGDVLSVPSGSVAPQPALPPPGTQNAQIAQYIIYVIAIAVVVILLVVFRRKLRRKGDE